MYWTTEALTGNRELGFCSGEGAWETATTSKEGSRRVNYPILIKRGSDKKSQYFALGLSNCIENRVAILSINYWRASLVPAAAVIPAPIVYIKVAAVKMLVVQFLSRVPSPPAGWVYCLFSAYLRIVLLYLIVPYAQFMTYTLRKLECFEHAYAPNTLAWNNDTGSPLYSIGFYSCDKDE